MKYFWLIVLVLACLFGGWYIGVVTAPIKTVTITDAIIREVQPEGGMLEPQKVIELPASRIVYVDRVITPPIREWQSLDEFLSMMPSIIVFKSDSCLWVAENIQKSLMGQGYPVSIAIARLGYYNGTYVTDAPGSHAGLMVNIQGAYYFYDPETKNVTRLF